MVQIAVIDRQARKTGHRHGADHFVGRRIDVERIEIDAQPHDFAPVLAQAEPLHGDALLDWFDHPLLGASFDEVLDVVQRHAGLQRLIGPQQKQHRIARLTHEPNQGPQQNRNPSQYRSHSTDVRPAAVPIAWARVHPRAAKKT